MLGLPVYYYYKRADIPAATHLPVLVMMGKCFKVRRVLEFGAGTFSTLTFLDRAVFPDVEQVVSFETDPSWKQRVEKAAGEDKRLQVVLIADDVDKLAARCDISAFDLVFVDNGPTAEVRTATIAEIARRNNDGTLVVVHDFEIPDYRQASNKSRYRFCFTAYCPHTGILSTPSRIDRTMRSKFRHMNKAMTQLAKELDPTDVCAWTRVINKTLQ